MSFIKDNGGEGLKKGAAMIYTRLTEKAMLIAYEAHHGQLDKSGVPYIFHPAHLA
jgi:(p)ppGpp synthase/HD superfamily hydrolase